MALSHARKLQAKANSHPSAAVPLATAAALETGLHQALPTRSPARTQSCQRRMAACSAQLRQQAQRGRTATWLKERPLCGRTTGHLTRQQLHHERPPAHALATRVQTSLAFMHKTMSLPKLNALVKPRYTKMAHVVLLGHRVPAHPGRLRGTKHGKRQHTDGCDDRDNNVGLLRVQNECPGSNVLECLVMDSSLQGCAGRRRIRQVLSGFSLLTAAGSQFMRFAQPVLNAFRHRLQGGNKCGCHQPATLASVRQTTRQQQFNEGRAGPDRLQNLCSK